MNKNSLKDCLGNLRISENNNKAMTACQRQYYQGLIVGMVSGLMQTGMTFYKALYTVVYNLPDDCITLDDTILPPTWLLDLNQILNDRRLKS